MKQILLFLFSLVLLAHVSIAQQSNKSKSKDRYREKEMPPKTELVHGAEQSAAWSKLAAAQLRQVTFALSEVMLHDVANPPAASRFYAYAMLAGYETASRYQPAAFPTLKGSVRDMPALYSFTPTDSVYFPFAALWAVLETGRLMMPSGYMLTEKQASLEAAFREKGVAEVQLNGSKTAAVAIAKAVADFAKTDGYIQLTALPRYRPSGAPGDWTPTPPDWMAAIEPHWSTLRPFFLSSADQFQPPAPAPFDTTAGSAFMALVREVYDTGRKLTPEQREIANFWDCNPFAVEHAGHMMIGVKKISPAGHWMNICGLACEQQNRAFRDALNAHTALALVMADAFISCWHEKYRGNRIRPITVINRTLDPNWQPLLQTPPFPEYTSGHSTVSAAAAEVLTHFLGDNVAFTDNTEALYGIPPRTFKSFRQAAEEASVSRLYGGIHFRDALDSGLEAGKKVGSWVLSKLPFKR